MSCCHQLAAERTDAGGFQRTYVEVDVAFRCRRPNRSIWAIGFASLCFAFSGASAQTVQLAPEPADDERRGRVGQPYDSVDPEPTPDATSKDPSGNGEMSVPEPPPAEAAAAEEEPAEEPAEPAEPDVESFFVPSRSYGTQPETSPPRYVRNIGDIPFLDPSGEQDWLDLGVDMRVRYEYRDDDYRRPVPGLDEPFLIRERAYIGVKKILDPFRFAVEFSDAWRVNSQYPIDDRDVNRTEIIQMIGELYFEDAIAGRTARFQAGRFAYEYVDRRLIARNEWRNTTNNFQGVRTIIGEKDDNWQLDLFAWQPIERLMTQPDRPEEEQMFYGAILDIREWSDVMTVQPYYLVLDQDGDANTPEREIHTLAVRGYGNVGDTGFDYDSDLAWQFGKSEDRSHDAFGATAEVGYTWDHETKPRNSVFFGYASGDRDPNDTVEQRFDRLFGFGRPWSADDYIRWENVITTKTRYEIQPHEKLRIDMGYGAYWLASSTDVWPSTGLQDPTGQSGSFLGHELDIRLRIAATERLDVTLGYAHWIAGGFTMAQAGWPDSDFLYVETTARLFK